MAILPVFKFLGKLQYLGEVEGVCYYAFKSSPKLTMGAIRYFIGLLSQTIELDQIKGKTTGIYFSTSKHKVHIFCDDNNPEDKTEIKVLKVNDISIVLIKKHSNEKTCNGYCRLYEMCEKIIKTAFNKKTSFDFLRFSILIKNKQIYRVVWQEKGVAICTKILSLE